MKSILLLAVLWMTGCGCITNPMTPPGHEGYVYSKPIIIGTQEFVATQVGPTSDGFSWRDFVINIDMRPQTYTEAYEILSADNLNVSFNSHARLSLRASSVQDVVEGFGGQNWYEKNVQQQYRAAIRREVRNYNAYDIRANVPEIETAVLTSLREQYTDTPMVFATLSVGNIDYGETVEAEIEAKLSAQQRKERMAIEEEVAIAEAKVRVAKAEGLAQAQRIINGTLTPLYIQHEAIEAYKTLAASDNTTFIIAPTSTTGSGIPLILGAR